MIKADGFTFREPIQLDLTRGEAFPGIFYLLSKLFMELKLFSLHILLNISSLVLQTLEQKSEQVLDYHHIII